MRYRLIGGCVNYSERGLNKARVSEACEGIWQQKSAKSNERQKTGFRDGQKAAISILV